MTSEIVNLPWIPAIGTQLRKAGVYFDAIRVHGRRGERAAQQLVVEEGGNPGPIVRELAGAGWVYFIVPPGTVAPMRWPSEAQKFSSATRSSVAFVGIPALDGDTWPLAWRNPPSPERQFCDVARLNTIVWDQSPMWPILG
ncbi:hypothetical protein JJV70_06160 [Streptomyces sp. JJ66]|uniref:hypothetical protein n=1 Tax=Streptomyces sp. JJ66 TaxID=2803843 RepID=UPI001C587EB9|nr:hypothetical protein [Streptomyces sp. JJ66]MBW1601702.1 hypothetical protein [Streptomyces sp. JJ66]